MPNYANAEVTFWWVIVGVGFVVVLFTFMGVNYLVAWFGLDSMHTYNLGDSNQPPSLGIAGPISVVLFSVLLVLALFSWLRIKFPRARVPRK